MEKKCFKCETVKPLAEFYRHAQMLDGHLNKCRDCTKKDVAEHREQNIDKIRHYDRNRPNHGDRLGKMAEYSKTRVARETHKAANKKWQTKNPLKKPANNAVARALKTGQIKAEACCVCGSENSEAHHEDYSRPLDVIWLCKFHHALRHRELNAIERGEIKKDSPSILDVAQDRGA